jgi:alkanesulfonate monooxygenase SsuD/methylene tetrahydromethanopterin reductase-like flavin-dependent oxidoreductase (luciferase family)
MRLSMQVGYAGSHKESAALVAELEQVGLDVAWIAEAYSFDAPSYMGYLAAKTSRVEIAAGILPLYTRTPSLLAMTAEGIDALSDGRCILGLGA